MGEATPCSRTLENVRERTSLSRPEEALLYPVFPDTYVPPFCVEKNFSYIIVCVSFFVFVFFFNGACFVTFDDASNSVPRLHGMALFSSRFRINVAREKKKLTKKRVEALTRDLICLRSEVLLSVFFFFLGDLLHFVRNEGSFTEANPPPSQAFVIRCSILFLPFSSTKGLGTITGHYYGWKHFSRRSFFFSLHQIRSYLPTARVEQHDVEFRHLNFCKVLVFFSSFHVVFSCLPWVVFVMAQLFAHALRITKANTEGTRSRGS